MSKRRKFKSGGSESAVTIDKTKKYKWDSEGDFVEYTGDAGDNEITVSGSKSSLRRMADIERNIAILATTLTTTDGAADDGSNASFGSNVNRKTRFKKEVRLDATLNVRDGIDMNGDKITELATPTANTDAANKSYVDAREAAAEATAATTAQSKVDALETSIMGASSPPGLLNTLNELAAAMGDDANHVTTMTNLMVSKDAIVLAAAKAYADANDSDTVYTLPASVVHDTEKEALHGTDALRISGHTIYLYKGDGTNESVTVPDNNTVYTHPSLNHIPTGGSEGSS